jgi:hypothetical protein
MSAGSVYINQVHEQNRTDTELQHMIVSMFVLQLVFMCMCLYIRYIYGTFPFQRWFGRPAHLSRQALLVLRTPVSPLRVFLRFRMGVHALSIDVGRRRGIPRLLRRCDVCDTGAVGDEHHFIFACPALAPM